MAKYDKRRAWSEARELIAEHRGSLAIGLALMVVNRLSGFVLPWTSKFLIDDIIGKLRPVLADDVVDQELRRPRQHKAGQPVDYHQRQPNRERAAMLGDQLARFGPRASFIVLGHPANLRGGASA